MGGSDAHQGRVSGHGDGLARGPDLQRQIHSGALAHHQMNPGMHLFGKTAFPGADLVLSHRQRGELIIADAISGGAAGRTRIVIFQRHARAGKDRAGWVGDRS